MEMPLVSIVVPVYNAADYIKETIESVKSQTFESWELILVDDCSTDNSVLVIEEFLDDERIRLIKNSRNLRAALSRNKGIEAAKGRYLAFIDADDIWKKEKLEKQLEFMREKDVAFSFTAYEFGDEKAVGTGKIVKVPEVLSYKKALSRTVIFTSTVMFDLRKINIETVMMPNVPSEDTATWWKILRSGFDAYGINEVMTVYRRPASSLSSNKGVAIRRIWNLYRNVEHLNFPVSAISFIGWAFRATLRRIV